MTSRVLESGDVTAAVHDRVARWYPAHPLPPSRIDRRALGWLFAPALYAICSGAFALVAGLSFLGVLLFVLVPAGVLLWGTLNMILTDWNGEATPADAALLESTDAWLAHVWIVQNNVVTGQDRGVIWFDEGALGFTGHQTSFLLTAEDVDRIQDMRNRDQGGFDPVTNRYTLSLREPDDPPIWRKRNVHLQILLLKPPEPDLCPAKEKFEEAFATFYKLRSELCPQFPPLALGPGATSIARLRLIALSPAVAAIGALFFWQALLKTLQPTLISRLDLLTVLLGFLVAAMLGISRPHRTQIGFLQGILKDEGRYPDRYARYSCLAWNIPLCIVCLGTSAVTLLLGLGQLGWAVSEFFHFPSIVSFLWVFVGLAVTGVGLGIGALGCAAGDRACRAPNIASRRLQD